MRNPIIMKGVVSAIYDMHTKSGILEAISAIRPRESSKLAIEVAIDEWHPACITRIAEIRTKLNPEGDSGHRRISDALDCIENTYLSEGG